MSTAPRESQRASADAGATGTKGLKAGALGLFSLTAWSLNSTTPAFSLAVTLGLIAPIAGAKAPSIVLVSFLAMLTVAIAYVHLTRYYPDCGQAFTWVTRAFTPYVGWVFGFFTFMMGVILFPNMVSVAIFYIYDLFGLTSATESTLWITFGGVVIIGVLFLGLGVRGVDLSTRVAITLVVVQLAGLLLISVITIVSVSLSDSVDSVPFSLSMLSPFGLSWSNFANAILLGLFLFAGWDVSASLSEEAKTPRTASLAMLTSTGTLVGVLVLTSVAATMYRGPQYLSENYNDVLAALAGEVLGSPWDKIVVIAVIVSALAGLLGMIVYQSRWQLSMATFKAFPNAFGNMKTKLARRYQVPATGVLIFGALVLVSFVVENVVNPDFVWDLISSFSLLLSLSYLIPALACPVLLRRRLTKSVANFLVMGVVPVIGALIMTAVTVRSVIDYSDPANSFTGGLFGIGTPVLISMGTIFVGIVLMIIWRFHRPGFFREDVESLGMAAPAGEEVPLPAEAQ